MIDLDNNATTRPTEGVRRAIDDALTQAWANPSSVHRAGQEARRLVELARESVGALLGVRPRTITFCSGGTESIDLAIRGTLGAFPPPTSPSTRRVIVTARTEHAAVRDLAQALEAQGAAEVRWLALDARGVVDVERAAELIDERVAIVSVQWANNETGAVQPVQALGALCRQRGVAFHVDATQWVGKMPARLVDEPDQQRDASELCCDLLTCSAHKLHGPKGVGALWARGGTRLRPELLGTQERQRRGGTENVPGIVGFGQAAREAIDWLSDPARRDHAATLRDRFERLVIDGVGALAPVRVNGPHAHAADRLWNTTNIAFPRLEAEALLLALSERGVAASAGAACSSGSLDPSPVLLAMGIAPELAHGSLRFSISRDTTETEIDQAAAIVVDCARRLYASMGGMA
jgi:cysteine desulfurase